MTTNVPGTFDLLSDELRLTKVDDSVLLSVNDERWTFNVFQVAAASVTCVFYRRKTFFCIDINSLAIILILTPTKAVKNVKLG